MIHVAGGAPRGHPEPDAQPVVVGAAQHERLLGELGGVFGHHGGVHHKSSGRDDHRFGAYRTGFGEVFPCHTHHRSPLVENERGRAGLVSDRYTELGGALGE
ncbi:SbmA protein [Mycobacteroides abscessus subsp. massiliense]|nr:SbmA protein [Mycobacteroides abscessus subsp. massiliense]